MGKDKASITVSIILLVALVAFIIMVYSMTVECRNMAEKYEECDPETLCNAPLILNIKGVSEMVDDVLFAV